MKHKWMDTDDLKWAFPAPGVSSMLSCTDFKPDEAWEFRCNSPRFASDTWRHRSLACCVHGESLLLQVLTTYLFVHICFSLCTIYSWALGELAFWLWEATILYTDKCYRVKEWVGRWLKAFILRVVWTEMVSWILWRNRSCLFFFLILNTKSSWMLGMFKIKNFSEENRSILLSVTVYLKHLICKPSLQCYSYRPIHFICL